MGQVKVIVVGQLVTGEWLWLLNMTRKKSEGPNLRWCETTGDRYVPNSETKQTTRVLKLVGSDTWRGKDSSWTPAKDDVKRKENYGPILF